MKIPYLDLHRQQLKLQSALTQSLNEILLHDSLLGGKAVSEFEIRFAAYIRSQYTIACANCTDALEISLRALGIKAGDEVIVPANGWMSAAEAVCLLNAHPVFIDNHPESYTIDTQQIEKHITSRTRAIIPIHLYGQPADMPKICAIAKKYHLKVIEDCAQAHGASIGGRKVGGWGDLAAFSFYPTKNLGAIGDAGAIVTQDQSLAESCRRIASHGQAEKNLHVCLGRNSRMDTLQAAVLNIKLDLLDAWNTRRQFLAQRYTEALQSLPLQLPITKAGKGHVFHLYVIQHENREWLIEKLQDKGIGTAIHYPQAVSDMQMFQDFKRYETPIASQQAKQLLSLPLYPELTDEEQDYIIESLHDILSN